jgi:YidC/Oxa1 family membrane protein insertase
MFRTFVEQPIFNLLELIYALIPGHDLGVSVILFTAIVRLALWPLVRKQLHHARAMRKLQPEIKKIKKAAAGDRQKEARLQMELYKEHEVKPFATIGTLIIQIPIFIGLYQVITKLIKDPNMLQTFSYSWIRDLPWIQDLAKTASDFDTTFLGLIDLSRKGIEAGGGVYFAAIVLAFVSSIMQYYQSKHMMQDQKDARKLSVILKEAASGKETDQAEVTAAVSRGMLYFLPFVTFIFAINLPSALSLYFFASSAVGYLQQRRVLNKDVEEMTEIAREGEVTTEEKPAKKAIVTPKTKKKKTSTSKKKRRAKK